MKAKITLLIILISLLSFGQNFKEKREKIKALKAAYITDKLNLTPQEAQKFWPVYNQYDDQLFEIRHHKMRTLILQMQEEENIPNTDSEALKLIEEFEKNEDELYLLRKKFLKEILKVLPPKKVLQLKKAEENFNRKLFKQFRDHNPKE